MPFTRTNSFKGDTPQTTLVVRVDTPKVDKLRMYIASYMPGLPPELQDLLSDIDSQLR